MQIDVTRNKTGCSCETSKPLGTYVFTSLVSCFIEGDMNVQKYIFMLVVNSR